MVEIFLSANPFVLTYLSINRVTKTYAAHTALKEVSIEIPAQSIFGLLGPNGAGKTTLIRIINQIIEADSGSISIKGEMLRPDHIRTIGYLPEERGLYKKMKVGEQLVFLGRLRGLNQSDAISKGKGWAERLSILEWWNKRVEDLSKGMAQKVQFIATVFHEPELIILDEPFSGFDPVNANLIKDEILKLRDLGSTVIFSTHRMESVEQLCDHIALINKSEKILEGSKKDIRNQFRSHTYRLLHVQPIESLEVGRVLKTESADQAYLSTIQLSDGKTPNDLLQALIPKTQILSFEEKIPSINEIFISQVTQP